MAVRDCALVATRDTLLNYKGEIIIKGASEGIGAEFARQLANERPRLVLAAHGAEGPHTSPANAAIAARKLSPRRPTSHCTLRKAGSACGSSS